MNKKVYVVKAFLDDATKNMEIPVSFLMSDNSLNDAVTTPRHLFKAIEFTDKHVGFMKRRIKTYKKATFILALTTGVLLARNHELKKEVNECNEKAKEVKENLESLYSDLEEKSPTDI